MIQTRDVNNIYTIILDFNRDAEKNISYSDGDILYPDITVTLCPREDSTNKCKGNTPCNNKDKCRTNLLST